MAALTQARLIALLTDSLKLREPRFVLERQGSMISGSVVSKSFQNKNDLERQQAIRNAVDGTLGVDARRQVGTILAYTPEEWDIDLEAAPRRKRVRVG
jgi:acid stress-induced BolA-like protein IbaG/YrbA